MVYCRHPNNGISLVDGTPNAEYAHLQRELSGHESCGRLGNWFEENEPERKPQSWWELFWSQK